MRAYKEETPINTIHNIRNILHQLQLLPIETSWFHPKSGLFSVRLENPVEQGKFGTNGKGRSIPYALASAYAEYMERIQNGFITGANGFTRLFMNSLKQENGFYYFPDEKIITEDEFLNLPKDYLNDIFGDITNKEIKYWTNLYFERLRDNRVSGITAVPFWNYFEKKIVYLPYNLTFILSGSNGMAAGNSKEECLFQALCELVERYSARTIFFNQLTPPTIPESFIEQFKEEIDIINQIRSQGYTLIVKDFSCGIGLPAVGVILINPAKNKYRLNIGAETSFKVALSRALTEIFQGIGDDSAMEQMMLNIPTKEADYFLSNSSDSYKKKENEIRKFIIDGTGTFPLSLFQDDFSYQFNELCFSSKNTYKEEVEHLTKIFHDLGYSVFMRDVSFLGFPSCYIYIPDISRWGRKAHHDIPTINSIAKSIEHDKIEDYFFPSDSLIDSPQRLNAILRILSPDEEVHYSGLKMAAILKLDFDDKTEWSSLSVNFFLTLISASLKRYKLALKFLTAFMEEFSLQKNEYYLKIKELFIAFDKNLSENELCKNFSSEIIQDFSSPRKIFSYISLPNCPHCGECPLTQFCHTSINYNNAITMANNMIKQINQEIL